MREVARGERGELAKAERAFQTSAQRRPVTLVTLFSVVCFVELVTQQSPTPKPGECSNCHVGGDVLEIGSVGSGKRMKGSGRVFSAECEDTVRDDNVVVDVQVEAASESLGKRNCSAVRASNPESWERLKTTAMMNIGAYEHLLEPLRASVRALAVENEAAREAEDDAEP